MSDEPTPPPLRLKPRVRTESEPAASAPPAASPPAAGPAADAAPKLRLKPKLSASSEETPPAAPESVPADPVAPPPADAIAAPPPASVQTIPPTAAAEPKPAEASTVEPPKFKLKVRPPEPVAPAASTIPPASTVPPPPPAVIPAPSEPAPPPIIAAPPAAAGAATEIPAPPPKFPVMAEDPAATQRPRPPAPVPHLRAPSGMKEEELLPGAKPARRKLSAKTLALVAIAAVVVAGAGAYFLLSESAPPPAPTAPKRAAKSTAPLAHPAKPGPTPSATLNAIAAVPGAAVGKARDVVAARRTLEQERVDALATGEEAPDKRALNTPPPAALNPDNARPPAVKPVPSVAIKTTAELAPGVSATTTVSEMSGTASPGFQAWVANARINGVFNGSPPRALINGRTVRAGQSVDDSLGIVFDSVDPQEKTISFRDGTGAKLTRRY